MPKRVKEIEAYVNTSDACFPTSIILAIPGVCAKFEEAMSRMVLNNYLEPSDDEDPIYYRDIAKVLDGQHRIEGLKAFKGEEYQVNVSIFIDADIADQAYIFSTVNLTQTKVNRSLAYDLFDLAKSRSPQKTCHNIAVALDQNEKSPFFQRIKRLGVTTEGRFNETITQATLVQSLMIYICKDQIEQIKDRDLYLRGKLPQKSNAEDVKQQIFRNLFIDNRDLDIADIIWNYFDAVKENWPDAWNNMGHGCMLNKTNGFKALMRFLRPAYLYITAPGKVPSKEQFLEIFKKTKLSDTDFTIDRFVPGTSGESELFRTLMVESDLNKMNLG